MVYYNRHEYVEVRYEIILYVRLSPVCGVEPEYSARKDISFKLL